MAMGRKPPLGFGTASNAAPAKKGASSFGVLPDASSCTVAVSCSKTVLAWAGVKLREGVVHASQTVLGQSLLGNCVKLFLQHFRPVLVAKVNLKPVN